MPLIGNVFKPLAKTVLIPLGLTAVASATDAAIHKRMFGSGITALIFANKEMNDIMKIVKSLEGSGLLIKGRSEKIKNEAKQKTGEFLGMLLSTLGTSLLGNLLSGKGTIRAGKATFKGGKGTIRAGEDTVRAGQFSQILKYKSIIKMI